MKKLLKRPIYMAKRERSRPLGFLRKNAAILGAVDELLEKLVLSRAIASFFLVMSLIASLAIQVTIITEKGRSLRNVGWRPRIDHKTGAISWVGQLRTTVTTSFQDRFSKTKLLHLQWCSWVWSGGVSKAVVAEVHRLAQRASFPRGRPGHAPPENFAN